jgi:DNA (cytosine-5)-methyltransferase 1
VRAVSLFSGAGIGESRLHEIGIDVKVANELIEDRATLYNKSEGSSKMIIGDIMDKQVFNELLKSSPGKLDLLIATPPCQGVSIAGKNRLASQQLEDERNHLLFPILKFIKETEPKNVLIENVPQYLKLLLPHKGKLRSVEEILRLEFSEKYLIESQVVNCADLGVPQSRKRAFIKLFPKRAKWEWPEKVKSHKVLEEVIRILVFRGTLPETIRLNTLSGCHTLQLVILRLRTKFTFQKVKMASQLRLITLHIEECIGTSLHLP